MAQQDVTIKITTDASQAVRSIKGLQTALDKLSNQSGASAKDIDGVNHVVTQSGILLPAASDAAKQYASALREVESAAQETASQTDNANKATKDSNNSLQNSKKVATGANFAVLSLSQTIQDSAQFSLGAAQGFRAINNNIQVMSQSLLFAADAAKKSGKSLRTELIGALKGPGGVLLLISIATAAIEFFGNMFGMAAKAANAAAEEVKSFSTVLSPFSRIGFDSSKNLGLFADSIGKIRSQDWAGISDAIGKQVAPSMGRLRDAGVDVTNMFVGLQQIVPLFGRTGVIAELAGWADHGAKAMEELSEDLEAQAAKAKAIEDIWTALLVIYGKAWIQTQRLAYDTKDLAKQIDEQEYQLYKLLNTWRQLGRLDLVNEQIKLLDQARTVSQGVSAEYDLSSDTVERLIDVRSDLLRLTVGEAAENRVLAESLQRQNAALGELVLTYETLFSSTSGLAGESPFVFMEEGGIEQTAGIVALTRQFQMMQGAVAALQRGGVGEEGGLLYGIIGSPEELAALRIELYNLGIVIDELSGTKLYELSLAITDAFETFKSDVFVEFATNLGNGVSLIDSAAGALLGSLGTMAIEMGRALIAFGVAGKAIESFIKDPVLAVVAGTALVAVGTALKNKASQIVKSHTSGSSSSAPASSTGRFTAPSFGAMSMVPTIGQGSVFQSQMFSPARQSAQRVELVASGRSLVSAVGSEMSASSRRVGGTPINFSGATAASGVFVDINRDDLVK